MDSEYEYGSDNSVEGIYIILANYTLIIILMVHTSVADPEVWQGGFTVVYRTIYRARKRAAKNSATTPPFRNPIVLYKRVYT